MAPTEPTDLAATLAEIAALEQPCAGCSSCARRHRRSNIAGLVGGMLVALAVLAGIGVFLEVMFSGFPPVGQN